MLVCEPTSRRTGPCPLLPPPRGSNDLGPQRLHDLAYHGRIHPILRTPHYSSAVDQYQDDGFGNPFNTSRLPDFVNTQALNFILEDLHS